MGMPQLRQPGPAQDERGPENLRLHRHPVLEPGTHPGDQGSGSAPVKDQISTMVLTRSHRADSALWIFS